MKKLKKINLESLKLSKFKENILNRPQLINLRGGGDYTNGGYIEGCHNGQYATFNYGYDSVRDQGWSTYHNRSNISYIGGSCTQGGGYGG